MTTIHWVLSKSGSSEIAYADVLTTMPQGKWVDRIGIVRKSGVATEGWYCKLLAHKYNAYFGDFFSTREEAQRYFEENWQIVDALLRLGAFL